MIGHPRSELSKQLRVVVDFLTADEAPGDERGDERGADQGRDRASKRRLFGR